MTKERTQERNGLVIASIIGTAALIASSGLAFADSKGLEVRLNTGASTDHRVQIVGINADGSMDVTAQGKAGVRMDDDNDGIAEKRQDSEHRQDSKGKDDREDKHATSTRSDNHEQGLGKGGIHAFFSWMLGLPASTTVGEIRAHMTASTTASTSHSEGLGFWARIFGAFRFGHND